MGSKLRALELASACGALHAWLARGMVNSLLSRTAAMTAT